MRHQRDHFTGRSSYDIFIKNNEVKEWIALNKIINIHLKKDFRLTFNLYRLYKSPSYQPFFSLPSNTTFGLYIGVSTKVGRMSEIRISLGEPPMESWKHKCQIRSELII